MNPEAIEQVTDVPATKNLSGAKVKNTKKALPTDRPCVYFKDMQCRAPVCDLEICQRCPEGRGFCMRVNMIRGMMKKILMFLVAALFMSDF